MSQYPTNLLEKRWQVINKLINSQERKRKHSLRAIMNAILSIKLVVSGISSPWKRVYYYFRKWKLEEAFEEVMNFFHVMVCKQGRRKKSPSLSIIDSRSVKTSHHVNSDRGIDGNKKVKGRKEYILVDTLRLSQVIAIHEANLHDRKGIPQVIERLA